MLSDNGSSIAFCDETYMGEIGLKALGQWKGLIETITSCTEVTTPFFRLEMRLEDSTYVLFALGCNGLGSREEIPVNIINDICAMFKANPDHIFRGGGKVRVLIGQDTGSLLLKPLTHICGKAISKYLPDFAKDLSLQTTPASPMLSLAGSIGQGTAMDGNTSVFACKVPKSHYTFFSEPEPSDLKLLQESHGNSTYSVKSIQGCPTPVQPSLKPPSGDDSEGRPPGPVPGTAQPAMTAQTSQPAKPDEKTKGFTLKTLTSKIQSLSLKKRLLPKFPTLATLLLSLSLLTRSSSAGAEPVTSRTAVPSFLAGKARYDSDVIASTLLNRSTLLNSTTGETGLQPSSLSALTCSVLARKHAFLFSVTALSACMNLLVDPNFIDPDSIHSCKLIGDDPDSKGLLSLLQCDACSERSRRCPGCRWLNSNASVQELAELELIRNCITVKRNPVTNQDYVEASYPFIGDLETLYSPEKSNYNGAVSTTRSLFKKLHKIGRAEAFNEEIEKSISEGHMQLLSKAEGEAIMKKFHCFSFLNFQLKDSSSSQKIRPVTNSSSSHVSGSANNRMPRGPNLLNNLRTIWEHWRLKRYVAISDLKRCYRCMFTCEVTNRMRLMVYPVNPLDPDNKDFQILYLNRSTYGDQICAALLELILREVIAPHCTTALGREILENGRYVDDLAAGDDSKEVLTEAMKDVSDTLAKFGFSFKHLLTNFMEGDGDSDLDTESELVFHHAWFYKTDKLLNMPKFNVFKKVRGSYVGPDLEETDVDNLVITKRLASRLMGQAFSIDGSIISPLKAVFAVFFSQICSTTDKWDEPIGKELSDNFKDFLKVLQRNLPQTTPVERCLIPPGYQPAGLDGQSDGSLYLSSWVLYLLAANGSNPNQFSSRIAGAACKVKHHSVVGNELLGIYLLTENVTAYVFNHHTTLFRSPSQPFVIRLGMDSECCLYSLNPLKLNKSILVKNAVRGIHSFCQDLTSK